ncbi:MAG: N-acetylmuramoyl-L-alanine amidase [Gammaproteobacteria bacterium]|nr:N-acetylmuramoyl-L-alanine amidase [Gammaproteobacteria bacterium]
MSSHNVSSQRRAFIQLLSRASGAAAVSVLPLSVANAAGSATLNDFKLATQDNLQLYFDLDKPPSGHKVFSLDKPDRLVIDLYDVKLGAKMNVVGVHSDVVERIRYATHQQKNLRVVVDLNRAISPSYKFVNRTGGAQRLVVDMGVKIAKVDGKKVIKSASDQHKDELREIVVAIDAGHGGRDPGAVGPKKTREKDITLAVARKLNKRLASVEGIKPVMIRDKDVFVSLRERTRKAREHKADLFISIHADAFPKKNASGSSVYALSLKGASSEAAQWLADKENAADLFGGVSLDGRTEELRKTLIDLAQNATLESSLGLGDHMLEEIRRVSKLHKSSVEQANFAVLKSPDIPSVLVETAFISNPKEEQKLRTDIFQDRLAKALHNAVMGYFERKAPPGTILASRLETRSS